MGRSLKASKFGISLAKDALALNDYSTQRGLAHTVNLSGSTISNFFKGKPVDKSSFLAICDALNLSVAKVADFNSSSNNSIDSNIFSKNNESTVERSIEFPPEYWEAGTSILSYFSRILNIKYPDEKIKVKIEQEDLTLRMVIDSPSGFKETIEKTLDEYAMVATGKLKPEKFLSDPLEVIRLTNKLEIAHSEVRQSKQLLAYSEKYNSQNQQRIESLEVQVSKLHCIIEQGLQSSNHAFGVIKKMTELEKSTYNLNQAKFGGGFAAKNGLQIGGSFIDLSNSNNPTDVIQQVQDLLDHLYNQGDSEDEAIQKAATELAKQANDNPTTLGKLVKYGKFIADAAGKTTVSEAVKGVIKLSLQILGI